MNVNLETNETEYDPGDMIQFRGGVDALLPGVNGTNGNSATDSATARAISAPTTVLVSLVDDEGVVLAAEAVQADQDGNYSGHLLAPQETRGEISLIAEAAIDNATMVLGALGWYGLAEKILVFPLNLAPQLCLATTTTNSGRNKFSIAVDARVIDPDRHNDIELITVTIHDGNGIILRQWYAGDFNSFNNTWVLNRHYSLTGTVPWIVTLTAEDSVGNVATTGQVVTLTDIVATL